jgi:catechol 2,3-dioxygenase-like lactoylglutathione lyase family enzyme
MPSVNGVLETSLYVADLKRSREFYETLFEFDVLVADDRMCALAVPGPQVLLLFCQAGSLRPIPTSGGVIPPHDGTGQLHLAFAITAADWDNWEARLQQAGVPVESRVRWSEGGRSLYFRDPDGHLVELATPGIWAVY